MRDIGALIWGLIVIIGVVSSIVQSAKRAAQQRQASAPQRVVPQRVVPPRPPPQPQSQVVRAPQAQVQMTPQLAALIRQFEQQAQAVAQPAPPPPPKPQAAPPPPAPPAPQPPPVEPHADERRTVRRFGRAGGLFGDRDSLIRGIVAAEVLGKPLALRDE